MNLLIGGCNATAESSIQNGGVHSGVQSASQTQSVSTKNSHRKSLDKGDNKQDEQQNKQSATNVPQSDKSDKRFAHSNGTTVPHNDLQFIERVG